MGFASMLARGAVAAVNAAKKLQTLQVRLLAAEVKDNVEHFEPYGFTSHPKAGAEHLTLFLDGDRSHGITVVVTDRRYRLQALPEGGVALYDSEGTSFVLSADGRARLTAAVKVEIDAPMVDITGSLHVGENIVADGDVADQGGKTMAEDRAVFNGHHHNLPGGGATLVPNELQG